MVQFKVGDRVRYTPCKGTDDSAWQNLTITKIDDEGYWADDDNPAWRAGYFPFANPCLELITTPTPTNITERMMALVEAIVDHGGGYANTLTDARAILDALKPVDGNLLAARHCAYEAQIIALGLNSEPDCNVFLNGSQDTTPLVQGCLIAIAKGRSLERGGE